jgi:hypothetical protein
MARRRDAVVTAERHRAEGGVAGRSFDLRAAVERADVGPPGGYGLGAMKL